MGRAVRKAVPFELSRFVKFSPSPLASRWTSRGGGARHRDQSGTCIGILEIKNSRSYAVVLKLDRGDVATFHPMDLFPERSAR